MPSSDFTPRIMYLWEEVNLFFSPDTANKPLFLIEWEPNTGKSVYCYRSSLWGLVWWESNRYKSNGPVRREKKLGVFWCTQIKTVHSKRTSQMMPLRSRQSVTSNNLFLWDFCFVKVKIGKDHRPPSLTIKITRLRKKLYFFLQNGRRCLQCARRLSIPRESFYVSRGASWQLYLRHVHVNLI